MAQCPRCKEDMPLLSQICPVCGFVHEGGGEDDANMSVGEFADTLEEQLRDIKQIPMPSFLNSMGQLTFVIFPIMAIYMLAMAMVSEAGMFWLLFGLFLILSIVSIVKKARGTLGNDKFNRLFKAIKSDFEYTSRVAQRKFGKSKEVSNLLGEIGAQIGTIERKRRSASSLNLLIWAIVLVVFFAAGGWGVFKTDKVLNDPAAVAASAVENVRAMSQDDPAIGQARMNAIAAILAGGTAADAEEFFVSDCMGNMQDLECAKLIVEHYVAAGDKEAAGKFIDRCTEMRYKSDVQKLRALIK